MRISFLVNRPKNEDGFRLERTESRGRTQLYATRAYATDRPEGEALRMSGVGETAAAARINLAEEFAHRASVRCCASSTTN